MDCEFLAALPGILDDGRSGDVSRLREHVEFAETIQLRSILQFGEFVLVRTSELPYRREPVVDDTVAEILQRRLDPAATVVPANDHITDFEDIYGILEHG